MTVQTALPPQDLHGSGEALARIAANESVVITLTYADGTQLEFPTELTEVLRNAAAMMATGLAVTVQSINTSLSTQQAAELLGVTRPTVVRLLETGQIPFTTPAGRHRRIQLSDILTYQQKLRQDRREAILDNAADATDEELSITGFPETR